MQTQNPHLHSRRWVLLCALMALLLAMGVACSSGDNNNNNTNANSNSNDNKTKINRDDYAAICPGSEGCDKNEGDLKAGAAAVVISPKAYEVAWWPYFKEEGFCPKPTPKSPFGVSRCGELQDLARSGKRDCGRDGICKGEKLRLRKECTDDKSCTEGTQCLEDTKRKKKYCHIVYKEPDADGSEKDGQPDWFLDCGRDRVCPCMDPDGKPAYYGKGKKCLIGHKANPDYKGPDADGSEGDKKFNGLWMGGFGNNHPLMGHNDDTWSRALVLQSGDTTVAIVSIDTVGFFYDDIDAARKKVMEKLPKGAIDYVLVSSTHTHEGPDTMGQWGPAEDGVPAQTGVNPKYNQEIIDNIAKSIMDAYNNLKPAKLKAAALRTGGVTPKRGVTGLVRDSRDPSIVDDTLTVLQAVGTDGTPISTMVNWGNHPEVLSDTNNFLSSDFAHYLREALEKGLPAGKGPKIDPIPGIAIYIQGAIGSLMTPLGVNIEDINGKVLSASDWDKTKALGDKLALKTVEALKKAEDLKDTKISIVARKVKLAVENLAFQSAFLLEVFKRKTYDWDDLLPIGPSNQPKLLTEVSIIRVGEFTFFSMPGELDPQVLVGGYDGKWSGEYPVINTKDHPDLEAKMKANAPKGPYLKERVPGKFKAFIGLGNDEIGYLLPAWNYVLHPKDPFYSDADGDHYEETNGLGPNALPTLMSAYNEMLGFIMGK